MQNINICKSVNYKEFRGGKILEKKLHMSKKSCNFAFELENYQFYHNNGVRRKSEEE